MDYVFPQYQESADFLRSRLNGFTPDVVMVLGSGLGFLGDKVENPTVIPYGDIPHFKVSTAPGHKGQLVCGTLAGKKVAVMQGRMHHYEGYSYQDVSYAVRGLHQADPHQRRRVCPQGMGGGRHYAHHRPHQVLHGISPPGREH